MRQVREEGQQELARRHISKNRVGISHSFSRTDRTGRTMVSVPDTG